MRTLVAVLLVLGVVTMPSAQAAPDDPQCQVGVHPCDWLTDAAKDSVQAVKDKSLAFAEWLRDELTCTCPPL